MPRTIEKKKYDIAWERKQQIARYLAKAEESLKQVYRSRSMRAVNNWWSTLKVLYFSIKTDCKETTKDEIESLFEEINEKIRNEDLNIQFKEIDKLHGKVNDARVNEAGMDIPTNITQTYGYNKKEIDEKKKNKGVDI